MSVPGTFERGHVERQIIEVAMPAHVGTQLRITGSESARRYVMGDCAIIVSSDAGLWHLSISCVDRHPTWDEIKTARYKLCPDDITMAMLLPPADEYFNLPAQDHVFHLWEVQDPRLLPPR